MKEMETRPRKVVVIGSARRTGAVLRWLRLLLPAAVLVVSQVDPPSFELAEGEAIVLESDDIDSPMALADALAKGHLPHVRD
jgi:hypothetical protein